VNREVFERLSTRLADVLAESGAGAAALREDIDLALASLDMESASRALDFDAALAALAEQTRHPLVAPVVIWELLAAIGVNRSDAELERLRAALRWTLRPGFVLMLELGDVRVGVTPTVFGGAAIHLWTPRTEPNESDLTFDYPERGRAFAAALEMVMTSASEPLGWYRAQGRGRHEVRSMRREAP
jgi:hypothetical protein